MLVTGENPCFPVLQQSGSRSFAPRTWSAPYADGCRQTDGFRTGRVFRAAHRVITVFKGGNTAERNSATSFSRITDEGGKVRKTARIKATHRSGKTAHPRTRDKNSTSGKKERVLPFAESCEESAFFCIPKTTQAARGEKTHLCVAGVLSCFVANKIPRFMNNSFICGGFFPFFRRIIFSPWRQVLPVRGAEWAFL